jgi:hypothetical protein
MVITSVAGHLIHIDFPLAYQNWQKCPLLSLFEAPIERKINPTDEVF